MTTAVSFPRTDIAVWPEPEMALKAYSMQCGPLVSDRCLGKSSVVWTLTDLVQTSLRGEDSEVSVDGTS